MSHVFYATPRIENILEKDCALFAIPVNGSKHMKDQNFLLDMVTVQTVKNDSENTDHPIGAALSIAPESFFTRSILKRRFRRETVPTAINYSFQSGVEKPSIVHGNAPYPIDDLQKQVDSLRVSLSQQVFHLHF